MSSWAQRLVLVKVALVLVGSGCTSTRPKASQRSEPIVQSPKMAPSTTVSKRHDEVLLASAIESDSTSDMNATEAMAKPDRVRPSYAQMESLPIDLPTVIRLIDSNSPAVAIARARVDEAQARLASAEVQWLPNLSLGTAYTRFDGQTQNQRGEVFGTSRANLFAGMGPGLSLDTADAIFRPLIERRQSAAERFRQQAVCLGAELEAVNAYIDLVQASALLAINADTIGRAEAMLKAAKNARDAKLDRTAGDVNRAQTEVLFRSVERQELEGRIGIASARLGRLLLLPANVKLIPTEVAIGPITLIDPNTSLDQLLATAIANRPDLAANREAIAAAWARVRRLERGPLLPKLAITNLTGGFGGGLNDDLQDFGARNALNLLIYWEIKNLGLGNRADAAERRAVHRQLEYLNVDAQARAVAEIVEAAQLATVKYESLDLAEQAVQEATELYRIAKEGTLNVIDAKNLFDALRPLQAIQALNQARQTYLLAVLEFNRAQYRLFSLTGHSTCSAAQHWTTKSPQS